MNIFKKIKASLRLYEAVKQAKKAHKKTGNRYYVLRTTGRSGQLVIMDRPSFRKMKHKRYISNRATISSLEKECFYCTPYRNGTGSLSMTDTMAKRKHYFRWVESL